MDDIKRHTYIFGILIYAYLYSEFVKYPLYGVLNEDTYFCILINGVRLNSGQDSNK